MLRKKYNINSILIAKLTCSDNTSKSHITDGFSAFQLKNVTVNGITITVCTDIKTKETYPLGESILIPRNVVVDPELTLVVRDINPDAKDRLTKEELLIIVERLNNNLDSLPVDVRKKTKKITLVK